MAQTDADRRIAALEHDIIDAVNNSACRGAESIIATVRATIRIILSSAPSMGIPQPVLAERLALICHAYLDSLTVPPP